MRCFIGVEIPAEIKKYYEEVQLMFRESFRWSAVKSDQIHVTMFFFGNVDWKQAKEIGSILENMRVDTFELILGEGKFFSRDGKPTVVYAEVASNALNTLRSEMSFLLRKFGFDDKPFKPHLTLARIKSVTDMNHFKDFLQSLKELRFMAKAIKFIKSELTKSGPVYTVLNELKLN